MLRTDAAAGPARAAGHVLVHAVDGDA
ncbi:hypothetical protein AGR7B_Lc180084 [Agrobacterium deltaense RV3]|nr:hypothetical protein AGR7B_Lc180084 [Agrobacterium deltaense RV3]